MHTSRSAQSATAGAAGASPPLPRVLVTGASGLLGRAVMREFVSRGFPATGLAFRRPSPHCLRADLTDVASIPALLDRAGARVVVHCAAERHPDACQRDPGGTRRLNVDATREIAGWCAGNGAMMILISTDYVFDGTSPPYGEDAAPRPLNAYGASKLAAEDTALGASGGDAAVLRVPILYGETGDLAESAVTVLAADLLGARAGDTLFFEARSIRYPTHTGDVAAVLGNMVAARSRGAPVRGIFHWTGREPMTKYDMARVMARLLPARDVGVEPDERPPAGAPRPADSHLGVSRLEGLGLSAPSRPFREAIGEILRPYRQPR